MHSKTSALTGSSRQKEKEKERDALVCPINLPRSPPLRRVKCPLFPLLFSAIFAKHWSGGWGWVSEGWKADMGIVHKSAKRILISK